MIEDLDKVLLGIHIAAGFSSLACFLIPLFVKKGGDWHIRTGKIYVFAMWIVVTTAAILSVINLIEAKYISAIFLGYLSIITSNPLWYGIAILKYKREIPDHFIIKKIWFERLVFFFGILIIITFFFMRDQSFAVVLLIFGILGLTAAQEAFTSVKKLKSKTDVLGEHIQGMITSGIASYTAFLVFGGYSFFADLYSGYTVVVFWTLPGILGGFTIVYFRKQYSKKSPEIIKA